MKIGDTVIFEWWSPMEIADYVRRVYDAFAAFGADLQRADPFDKYEKEQIQTLYAQWSRFHSGVAASSLALLTASTVNIAEKYAQELDYWRKQFDARSPVKASGPGVSFLLPTPKPPSTEELIRTALIYGGSAVSLITLFALMRR